MNLDGPDLQLAAYVFRRSVRLLERENGHRWYELRDLARRVDLAARADRYGGSMLATVTAIAPPSSRPTVRCADCGRDTDRPRRGLCNRCRMRRARAS